MKSHCQIMMTTFTPLARPGTLTSFCSQLRIRDKHSELVMHLLTILILQFFPVLLSCALEHCFRLHPCSCFFRL